MAYTTATTATELLLSLEKPTRVSESQTPPANANDGRFKPGLSWTQVTLYHNGVLVWETDTNWSSGQSAAGK